MLVHIYTKLSTNWVSVDVKNINDVLRFQIDAIHLVLDLTLSQVVPGELTIVTGVPNSGKSEWIDALLCNLNRSVGWKFALCSMENKVNCFCFPASSSFLNSRLTEDVYFNKSLK